MRRELITARGIAIAIAALLGGCARFTPYEITRTVGGEARRGVFVAPSQYEDFVRGELAATQGDWAAAADAYERARAGGEDDVLLLSRLADARDHLGDRAHAEEALARAESLDASAEIVWRTRGMLAERHGETEAAVAAYERAVAAEPASEEAVLALARVLAGADHADRAAHLLADFVQHAGSPLASARASLALAVQRGDAAAAADAASALVRIAPGHAGEVEAAVRTLRERGDAVIAHRLLARLPDEAVDRDLAIEVAIAAGDRAGAERWLAFPAHDGAASLVRDARHWLALGEPARAAELAEVALAAPDASSEATLVLAHAQLASGRPVAAARSFASIVPGSSAEAEARRGLAEALAAAGLPALGAELLEAH